MNDTHPKTETWSSYLIALLGIWVLTPILITTADIWDGGQFQFIATKLGDYAALKAWTFESRWTLQYYFYVVEAALVHNLGIPYGIFSNCVKAAAVIGICIETYRITTQKLGLSKPYAHYALAITLVSPPLATLLSSVLTFHIFCVWCFLFSTRLAQRSLLAALPFFVFSLSLNSIFALAVGYVCFTRLVALDKENWRRLLKEAFLFSLVLSCAFVAYRVIFPPYGVYKGYNSYDPRWLSIIRYCLLSIGATVATYYLLPKRLTPEERWGVMRRAIACFLLFFFACFAYWFVGKPVKLLGTNAFTPRHAYLAIVPFAMLMAFYFEQAVARFGRKVAAPLFIILVVFLFSYQYAAFQQKFAQLLYRDMLAYALKQVERPKPGYVVIKVDRGIVPKYYRDFPSLNGRSLFDAYGEVAWVVVPWDEATPFEVPKLYGGDFERIHEGSLLRKPENGIYTTTISFDLKKFDPFGSPITIYDYFTRNYGKYSPHAEFLKELPPPAKGGPEAGSAVRFQFHAGTAGNRDAGSTGKDPVLL